jgi:hypothetical protein
VGRPNRRWDVSVEALAPDATAHSSGFTPGRATVSFEVQEGYRPIPTASTVPDFGDRGGATEGHLPTESLR